MPDTQLDLFALSVSLSAPDELPDPLTYSHWLGTYHVDRTYSETRKRRFIYLRYYWMEDGKTKHVHVPGGEAACPLVTRRRQQIERWIEFGFAPKTIARLIKELSPGRGYNIRKR